MENAQIHIQNAPKYAAWKQACAAAEAAADTWIENDDEAQDEALSSASDAADAARDDAFRTYEDSDEPRVWTLQENGHDYCADFVGTMKAAMAEAEGNIDSGNYDDVETIGTQFHEIRVHCIDTGESDGKTITIDPDEPKCSHEDGHDWQAPHRIVGGLIENPGVHGHGGGVTVDECCMRCGCRKHTDTWAQNPVDGTQGHETVEYSPGYYADELGSDADD